MKLTIRQLKEIFDWDEHSKIEAQILQYDLPNIPFVYEWLKQGNDPRRWGFDVFKENIKKMQPGYYSIRGGPMDEPDDDETTEGTLHEARWIIDNGGHTVTTIDDLMESLTHPTRPGTLYNFEWNDGIQQTIDQIKSRFPSDAGCNFNDYGELFIITPVVYNGIQIDEIYNCSLYSALRENVMQAPQLTAFHIGDNATDVLAGRI